MYRVDLNCDMGEGFGAYRLGNDEALMPLISSANIACGFHAGDPGTMARTVALAVRHGVAIGAHPGLPDREGFGRRHMQISPQEAYELTLYQVGAMAAMARAAGGRVQHVKAHGALYNMAAKEPALARAIAQAVADLDPGLLFIGLAGSELIVQAKACGLRVASEAFADRTYQPDGSLTPRSRDDALVASDEAAVAQVLEMVTAGRVRATNGEWIALQADTICLHGDGANALSFAQRVRAALQAEGVDIRAG